MRKPKTVKPAKRASLHVRDINVFLEFMYSVKNENHEAWEWPHVQRVVDWLQQERDRRARRGDLIRSARDAGYHGAGMFRAVRDLLDSRGVPRRDQ